MPYLYLRLRRNTTQEWWLFLCEGLLFLAISISILKSWVNYWNRQLESEMNWFLSFSNNILIAVVVVSREWRAGMNRAKKNFNASWKDELRVLRNVIIDMECQPPWKIITRNRLEVIPWSVTQIIIVTVAVPLLVTVMARKGMANQPTTLQKAGRVPVLVALREQLCCICVVVETDSFLYRNQDDVAIANQPTTANSLGLDIEWVERMRIICFLIPLSFWKRSQDVGYLATIQIGTPPQDFLILMDSGSADLWVGAEKCQSQAGGDCVNTHISYLNSSGLTIDCLFFSRATIGSWDPSHQPLSWTQVNLSLSPMELDRFLVISLPITLPLLAFSSINIPSELLPPRVLIFRTIQRLLMVWWV